MNCKLYQGDCLEVMKTLDFHNVIIVTDPPFNIGYHYNQYKDKMKKQDYFNMLIKIRSYSPTVFIHYPEFLYKFSSLSGEAPIRVVSWVYNSNTAKQHRDIAFYGVNPNFNQVKQPYKNLNDKRIQKRIAEGKTGAKLYDWWNINQVKNVSKDKTNHPCQMPLKVMENIIGILPENTIILDPFMGSGTTGIACINTNHDFIGIELDSTYFSIAEQRIKEADAEEKMKIESYRYGYGGEKD